MNSYKLIENKTLEITLSDDEAEALKALESKIANFVSGLPDDNFEDEDTIFKTKLEIFNLPEVKNSKNREMKMKVRKAKTVPEIFAAYYDIQHSNS